MTRNQKIALGCGGAGCLGLIVIIAGVLIFHFAMSGFNLYGLGSDSNSNRNDNSINRNVNSSRSSSSSSSSSSAAGTLSKDEKHRLYQAAGMTGDGELVRRVSVKIGLMNEDYTPGDDFRQFVIEHASWVIKNQEFIQSINTEEKAREYLNENLPE